jgi:hypothetical protein
VIELGKFHSFIGFESHFATDNMLYTKSYATSFATPGLMTGVHVMIPMGDFLKADLYVVNGWNKSYDNNKSKSMGASLSFKPIEEVEILAKALGGNETTNGGADTRTTLEGDAIFKPWSDLKLAVSFIATQESISGGDPRKVSSLAAYGQYKLLSDLALSARYEMYTDDSLFGDGLRSAIPVATVAQTINSASVAIQYWAAENLQFKGEYRMDITNASPGTFVDATGNAATSQSLGVVAGVLSF